MCVCIAVCICVDRGVGNSEQSERTKMIPVSIFSNVGVLDHVGTL